MTNDSAAGHRKKDWKETLLNRVFEVLQTGRLRTASLFLPPRGIVKTDIHCGEDWNCEDFSREIPLPSFSPLRKRSQSYANNERDDDRSAGASSFPQLLSFLISVHRGICQEEAQETTNRAASWIRQSFDTQMDVSTMTAALAAAAAQAPVV